MATINQSYNGFAARAREATEKLQRVVIANVELATRWTELVAAFSGANGALTADAGEVVQDSAEAVTEVRNSTDAVVDVAGEAAAAEVDEQQEHILAAERAEAKHAHELAREPYLSLTKAELSALLIERGLPKTGTINTLVERLVSSDAK